MGSFLTGATGTGNNFAAQAAPIQGQNFTDQLSNAQGQYNDALGNQNNLAAVLQAQMGGGGPNPEQLQFQRNTENAIKQNTGMIASQKGINPALAQRMAAQNAAGMSQQAAGQAAEQGMQKQLSAQGALQGLYGSQANQAMGQQSTLQNALAAYNNAQVGATSNMNNTNQATHAQNAATAGGLVGGMMGGASGIVSSFLAKGGVVPEAQHLGAGGPVLNNWGYGMQPQVDAGSMASNYINSGGKALGQGLSTAIGAMAPSKEMMTDDEAQEGYQTANGMLGGANPEVMMPAAAGGAEGLGSLAMLAAAHGGEIPPHMEHMARLYHPEFAGQGRMAAEGGPVPGQAQVEGNSYKNDTVPTMLSPGEIVLPRTVTQSENPVKSAGDFVAEQLRKKQDGESNHSSDFHDALKMAIGSRRSK